MPWKIAVAGLFLALAGCGTADSEGASASTGLEAAYDSCDALVSKSTTGAIQLADSGRSILIDTSSDVDVNALACLTVALDTSDAVVAQMDSTTAMMGRQEAEANGYNYEWSYHPDSGINMVITE